MLGAVRQLWRYPVSSLSGELLDACALEAAGLRGDRRWGLVRRGTDEIASPSRRPWRAAPEIEARGEEDLALRLPGGDWLAADGAAARDALDRHFGFAVELRRHPDAALPAGTPTIAPRYALSHVHLLSSQSLASLQALLPESRPLHPRRFRPNVVVDLPGAAAPFPETGWGVGAELTIGATRLTVVENCVRCAFVVLAQGDQPKDPAVLDAITRHNGTVLGVLCSVLEPGPLALGDPVRLA